MRRKALVITWIALVTLSVPVSPGYPIIDPTTLVAVWLFDEGSGDVAIDSSVNGNDAIFEGHPEWVEGKIGKALRFDGSTAYVAAEDSPSLDIGTDQLTLMAWVNAEGWPAANHVIRKVADGGSTASVYILRVDPDTPRGFLNTQNGETVFNGTSVLPTDKWVHLALAYDGAEARLYVNGELDGSAPSSGELTQSDSELRIGRGEPAGYFLGIIDEVAIFSSSLTQDDIRAVMDSGLASLVLSVQPSSKLTTQWAQLKRER